MCAVKCVGHVTMTAMRCGLPGGAARVVVRCARGSQLRSMTTNHDLLGQLRTEWHRFGRTGHAKTAFERFRAAHPEVTLDGLHDLGDVVAALEPRGGRSVLERAAIVRALLEEAHDPLLHRTLLQTLIPGIVSVCRQLRFGDGIVREPSETVAMAMGLANELISDWAGQSRPYAGPDLLSALRGRLRRWLLKEKAALTSLRLYTDADQPALEASPLETRINSYRGSQYDRMARLTYARVFEGRSLKELARDDRSAPTSLQAELQHFAIRFLL
jgi:hypothetical protein